MAHRSLSLVAERPVVALCAGKDCRKRCEFVEMREALGADCDVVELACVGLCNGPVAVLDLGSSKPVVYSKLRSKRQRRLVVAAATGSTRARKDLSGRRVTKKKVVTRVSRQTKRRLSASTLVA